MTEKTNTAIGLLFALLLLTPALRAAEGGVVRPDSDRAFPTLDCVIEPSEIVDVGSAAPGIIESIQVDRSDVVERGALIASLESDVERASAEVAAARAEATSAIEQREVSWAFSRRIHKRNQELFARDTISAHDIDKLETESRLANLRVREARENKRIAELEWRRAKATLDRRTVRSPVTGVVTERFKSAGEYVDDTPLLRVAQLDPLHVEVIVPVEFMERLVPGMRAEVTPDVAKSEPQVATVVRVDRVADAASGTFGVRLALVNAEHATPAGVRCQLDFLTGPTPTGVSGVNPTISSAAAVAHALGRPAQDLPANRAQPLPDNATQRASRGVALASASAADVTPATSAPMPAAPRLETTAAPLACYEIGPLPDRETAEHLLEDLAGRAANLAMDTRHGAASKDLLVVTQPGLGRTATAALLARLDAADIDDRFLLRRGPYSGRVSLGLYRDAVHAERRRRRLSERGFPVEVVPRHPATPTYWVKLSVADNLETVRAARDRVATTAPRATFEATACGEIRHAVDSLSLPAQSRIQRRPRDPLHTTPKNLDRIAVTP